MGFKIAELRSGFDNTIIVNISLEWHNKYLGSVSLQHMDNARSAYLKLPHSKIWKKIRIGKKCQITEMPNFMNWDCWINVTDLMLEQDHLHA